MRASIKIVLSLAFAASVVGCGALEEASQAASDARQVAGKAQTCIDAINVVNDLSSLNPSEAIDKAQGKAAELQTLAEKASDTNVKEAFTKAADGLNNLANLTPEQAASKIQEQINALKSTCS